MQTKNEILAQLKATGVVAVIRTDKPLNMN